MNNIFQVLKLDHYTVKTSYPRIIMIYFISLFIGISTQPIVPIFMIMFFGVSISGLTFSIIEKNSCEKIYGILPIRRKQIIIGRYLYGFILGIINLIISVVLAYILAMFSQQQTDSFILFFSITSAFCYYTFAVSVTYPIYYKFGFSKSYIFITIPLYLLILLVVFISDKFNFNETISQLLIYFSNHYVLFLFCGLVLGMFMLIISAVISYCIFRNSEL